MPLRALQTNPVAVSGRIRPRSTHTAHRLHKHSQKSSEHKSNSQSTAHAAPPNPQTRNERRHQKCTQQTAKILQQNYAQSHSATHGVRPTNTTQAHTQHLHFQCRSHTSPASKPPEQHSGRGHAFLTHDSKPQHCPTSLDWSGTGIYPPDAMVHTSEPPGATE